MKVVHVVEAFWGGVFDFLVNLTKGLDDVEHIIVYSTRKETPKDFKKYFGSNVKFIHRPSAGREVHPLKDLKAFWNLIKILKKQNADIYHLHSSKAWFLGRLALKVLWKSSKVIYSIHGLGFADPNFGLLQQRLYKFLEKIAYKFGGKVVGNSAYEAQVFKNIWIPAGWIPNTFDCKSSENLELKKQEPKSKIIIANMWRLVKVKNPQLFASIAQQFVQNSNIEFWWIGWPAGEFKFPANVKITNWLSHSEAMQRLAQADIFLFTSSSEAVPMAVLEAMCLYKPVVARKIPWVEELIEHSQNGFLFEDIDEAQKYLQDLISNPDLRKKVWAQAHQTIKDKFDFQKWLKQYRELYQRVTG